MKKIFLLVCVLLCVSVSIISVHALSFSSKPCQYNGSIEGSLDGCLQWSNLVDASGPTLLEGNVKVQVVSWTNALAAFLGLLAVGAIVYGGLLMTLSGGEDEKIKKGKDIIKWSLLWFLALIVAGAVVRIVVEVMFSFA